MSGLKCEICKSAHDGDWVYERGVLTHKLCLDGAIERHRFDVLRGMLARFGPGMKRG